MTSKSSKKFYLSGGKKWRCNALIFAVVLTGTTEAVADIQFDVLTRCQDIATVYGGLVSRASTPSARCHAPTTFLEESVMKYVPPPACLVNAPLAPFLNGYSCASILTATKSELLCFRPIPRVDIESYLAHSESFERAVDSYLTAAKQCSASNSDAARAPNSLMSPILAQIARFEFGFVASLGRGRKTDSYILHGFTTIDPSLSTPTVNAMEYVEILTTTPDTATTKADKVGNWYLEQSPSREASAEAEKAVLRQGVTLLVDFRSIDIERRDGIRYAREDKEAIRASLQDIVAGSLARSTFIVASNDDVLKGSGKSMEQLLDQFQKSLGYGNAGMLTVDKKVIALTSTRSPLCTASGGLLLALILAVQQSAETRDDIGSVVLVLVGSGDCALRAGATKVFVNNVEEDAVRSVYDAMAHRP